MGVSGTWEDGKAPDGGKLLLPPGWAIWKVPLKFKTHLFLSPVVPLLLFVTKLGGGASGQEPASADS